MTNDIWGFASHVTLPLGPPAAHPRSKIRRSQNISWAWQWSWPKSREHKRPRGLCKRPSLLAFPLAFFSHPPQPAFGPRRCLDQSLWFRGALDPRQPPDLTRPIAAIAAVTLFKLFVIVHRTIAARRVERIKLGCSGAQMLGMLRC